MTWTGLIVDGERLRALRRRRGLSQMALGSASGTCGLTVGRMERGEGTATPASVALVADALGVSLEDLLAEDADPTAATPRRSLSSSGEPSASQLWAWLLECVVCGDTHEPRPQGRGFASSWAAADGHAYRMRARSADVRELHAQWRAGFATGRAS